MNKRIIILIIFLAFLAIIFLITALLSLNSNDNKGKIEVFPTPTTVSSKSNTGKDLNPPIPGQSEEYKKGIERINATEAPLLNKGQRIIDFRDSLPYYGAYITVSYIIDTNNYQVVYKEESKQLALEELNQYLKKYNLTSSDFSFSFKLL